MTKITKFFRQYPYLGMALCVAVIAGVSSLIGQATWGNVLIGAFSIFMACRLLIDIIRDLRGGTYGVDILAAVAIIATIAVGEYWATIIIVIIMTSGEALEKYALPDQLEVEIALPGWTQELVDRITANYDRDVAEIAALPGIEFISP